MALGFAFIGCYEMNVARLRVRTPSRDQSCVEMADAVFNREGFAAVPRITGIDRLYTPRASTRSSLGLRWGIALTIDGGPDSATQGPCDFELQAVSQSEDELCGLTCAISPQPGYDDVTRKMAGLLNDAYRGHGEE
jgi:hypothetical protein